MAERQCHVSRLSFYVLRVTFHASRITLHASRSTLHALYVSPTFLETFRPVAEYLQSGAARWAGRVLDMLSPKHCNLFIIMKLAFLVGIALTSTALAATEEQINKHFTVQPGGKLVVEVDFGSINVSTNSGSEVVVDAWRKVSRSSKSAEEEYLKSNPVEISQDGTTVTVRCRSKVGSNWSWTGHNQNQAKYTVTVPAQFNASLKTAAGTIETSDLTGEVTAHTSGGSLHFARLHGPLDGNTSGGRIQVKDCDGTVKIHTSGGGIDVAGGTGTLDGGTSGGAVTVKNFHGPTHVSTSGGGITVENVAGELDGSTSGGSIHAVLLSPLADSVKLSTSGGGVTVRVPGDASFDLDAKTSAGGVSSELPVSVVGKAERSHLKGTVNGGGKSVVLRTSAGGINIQKL